MSISPDLEQFVADQVKAGNYPSREAVIEAALADLRSTMEAPLAPEVLAAIDESEDQIERGEYREWREVSAELRKKYLS